LRSDNGASRQEEFGLIADRALMRRVAVLMLVFGGTLELTYSLFFNPPDWTDAAAIALTVLAAVWVSVVSGDDIGPLKVAPPVLMGVAALSLIVAGDNAEVGISFLFLPAAAVMIFFWRRWVVLLAVMIPLVIAWVAVPAIWGDHAALVESLATLPLLIGSGILIGVLFQRIRSSAAEQARFRGTITALLVALEARDNFTTEHSSAVLALVMDVAEDLGLDTKETLHAADVALLHDIGKIGIPDEILAKPAALSESEWEIVRRHPEIGQRILNEVPGLEDVATDVRHEHERWDGSGYPDGLKGEEIPLSSRIALACDAYEAMISERPYRAALSDAQAREQLRSGAGSQFDPRVVDALLAALDARATVLPAGRADRIDLGADDHSEPRVAAL
jgi:hypothetical protein